MRKNFCRNFDRLLSSCADALIAPAQPIQNMERLDQTRLVVVMHGGRYTQADYKQVSRFLARHPLATVWLFCLGGTFEPQALKGSAFANESAFHRIFLMRHGVKNPIRINPVARHTLAELQAAMACPDVMTAKTVLILSTDIHALRVRLLYRKHMPVLKTFLRPAGRPLSIRKDQKRILQEACRILLYSRACDLAKPIPLARRLFFDIMQHIRSHHPNFYAGLLQEQQNYILKHFSLADPFELKAPAGSTRPGRVGIASRAVTALKADRTLPERRATYRRYSA